VVINREPPPPPPPPPPHQPHHPPHPPPPTFNHPPTTHPPPPPPPTQPPPPLPISLSPFFPVFHLLKEKDMLRQFLESPPFLAWESHLAPLVFVAFFRCPSQLSPPPFSRRCLASEWKGLLGPRESSLSSTFVHPSTDPIPPSSRPGPASVADPPVERSLFFLSSNR